MKLLPATSLGLSIKECVLSPILKRHVEYTFSLDPITLIQKSYYPNRIFSNRVQYISIVNLVPILVTEYINILSCGENVATPSRTYKSISAESSFGAIVFILIQAGTLPE